MRIIKNILALICAASGLLIVLFFRNYEGRVIPYPILWWLLGILLLPFSSWLFYSARKERMNDKRKVVRQAIEKLKSEADVIHVDVDDCEVLTGYDKIIDDGEINVSPKYQMFSAFLPEDDPSPEIDKESSVIVFKTDVQGKEMKFVSRRIRKDGVTMEFLLANKKQIDLYVDKNNPQKYWFDLDFLND